LCAILQAAPADRSRKPHRAQAHRSTPLCAQTSRASLRLCTSPTAGIIHPPLSRHPAWADIRENGNDPSNLHGALTPSIRRSDAHLGGSSAPRRAALPTSFRAFSPPLHMPFGQGTITRPEPPPAWADIRPNGNYPSNLHGALTPSVRRSDAHFGGSGAPRRAALPTSFRGFSPHLHKPFGQGSSTRPEPPSAWAEVRANGNYPSNLHGALTPSVWRSDAHFGGSGVPRRAALRTSSGASLHPLLHTSFGEGCSIPARQAGVRSGEAMAPRNAKAH